MAVRRWKDGGAVPRLGACSGPGPHPWAGSAAVQRGEGLGSPVKDAEALEAITEAATAASRQVLKIQCSFQPFSHVHWQHTEHYSIGGRLTCGAPAYMSDQAR